MNNIANDKKVIGRLYFKLSKNGNLLGEYSNNYSTKYDVELAKRDFSFSSDAKTFIGKYLSIWTEGTNVESATLEITRKTDTTGLFSLIWRGNNDKPLFEGEGMIVDKMLIANYKGK